MFLKCGFSSSIFIEVLSAGEGLDPGSVLIDGQAGGESQKSDPLGWMGSTMDRVSHAFS